MSNKPLHDGSKIYDTPRCGSPNPKIWPGYNGGCESYPTHGVGSAWEHTAEWEEKLFHRVLSIFDFTLPDTWDRDFTLWVLFRCGFMAIINAKNRIQGRPGFGVIPQYCTFSGHNVFYQPTKVLVANSLIKPENWIIGKNAALVKLTPGFNGCWGIVHYHAEKLAMLSQALDMAILNSRLAYGFLAENNAVAQTFYALMDAVDQGDPVVAVAAAQLKNSLTDDGKLPYFEIQHDVGKNYLVDKLQAAIEKQIEMFDRDIGIPVMNDKKERQISGEVDMVEKTALTAIDVWYDTLQRSIEQAKRVFPGLNFSVSKPNFQRGGASNEPSDSMEPGKA